MRRLLLAALLCLVGWQADAAIARGNTNTSGLWCQFNTTGHINAPCGSTMTVGASDTIVIVDATVFATSGAVINFVQVNGQTCSGPYKSVTDTTGGAVEVNSLYYCLSPAPGSGAVSIDYTGTGAFAVAYAVAYQGVDVSTPFDTGATGNSANCPNGTSCVLATTVNNAGDWLHAFVLARNGTVSGGTNTTLIAGQTGNGGQPTYADSNGTVATGSRAANWTAGAASDWPGQITVALCPTGGCAAAPASGSLLFGSPF